MKLRTLIFWPHLIAGVSAGAVILLMSVTGVVLTYERQMIAWSNGHLRSTPPAVGADRLSAEELVTRLRQAHPDLNVASITFGSEADAPVLVPDGQRTTYVDAYSGRVLGEGAEGMRAFMSDMRAWHRWLAVEGEGRTTARLFTGWSNVVFAFIVLSGIYLWFPRRWTWQLVRPVVFFAGRKGKARDFNWHNVIGAWSAIPLFIVVVSAVPISFQWGNDLVYRMVGEEPPARGGGGRGGAEGAAAGRGRGAGEGEAGRRGPAAGGSEGGARRAGGAVDGDRLAALAGLNALVTRAAEQMPDWRTMNVRLPALPDAPVVFALDAGEGGQPQYRATLTLDRQGRVVSREAFSDLSLGRRIRNVMRFAHTGEVLGIPGQTVAGLVSAGGVVLVWTGLALALRRGVAWVRRTAARRTQPMGEESPAA
jgi:uncharacterized iron-regulated membrane protein